MPEAIAFSCERVTRAFGGLVAVNDVTLGVAPCSIHAVIGTNGAGKSTLLSILAGELHPDTGTIHLGSRPVTTLSQPQRARAGIGRTYQRNTLFEEFTVLENCSLSAQSRNPRPWALFERAASCRQTHQWAQEAISVVGLDGESDRIANTLSHGQKRQLEIAMCLAHAPDVLLLDEPLAGMGIDESGRMLELLLRLKRTHAIVLVEHDMPAVFQVADALTVMVNGQVIAAGEPQRVRRDPKVIAAYLGEEHARH